MNSHSTYSKTLYQQKLQTPSMNGSLNVHTEIFHHFTLDEGMFYKYMRE